MLAKSVMHANSSPLYSPEPQPTGGGSGAASPAGRDRHGAASPEFLTDIASGNFLNRTASLLQSVEDQISTSLTSRLPIQLRYQLALEYMQAAVELCTRTNSADLQAVADHALQRAVPLIRSAGENATQFGDSALSAAWKHLQPIPGWQASKKSISNGTVVLPIFYAGPDIFIDPHLLPEERELLAAWYRPTVVPYRYLLVNREALAEHPEQATKVAQIILSLSGHDDRALPGVLERCAGGLPLTLGPLRLEVKNGAWFSIAKHPHLRVPFGSLPSSREFLTVLQREIEAGALGGHTVQVAGRISLDFLSWATGRGVEDPGPIPDIEILYAMPLASGQLYKFTLKPARHFTQRATIDRSTLSPEDAQVVSSLEHYFRDPEHRRRPTLLADLKAEHFSPEL